MKKIILVSLIGLLGISLQAQKVYDIPLDTIYNLGVSYHLQGDSLAAQSYFDKYGALLSIPFYSGNGLEKDSAFVVRSVADEYLILQEMGYRLKSQHLIHDKDTGQPYDLMKVVDESGNEAEFYFNIYQPYVLGMAKIFVEDEKEKEDKKDKNKRKKKKKN